MQISEIKTQEVGTKHPKLAKIWFYLTCWRPITKYEYNKLAGAVVQLYNTEVKARVAQDNEIITYLQGETMTREMKKDEGDEMYA